MKVRSRGDAKQRQEGRLYRLSTQQFQADPVFSNRREPNKPTVKHRLCCVLSTDLSSQVMSDRGQPYRFWQTPVFQCFLTQTKGVWHMALYLTSCFLTISHESLTTTSHLITCTVHTYHDLDEHQPCPPSIQLPTYDSQHFTPSMLGTLLSSDTNTKLRLPAHTYRRHKEKPNKSSSN